jgi:hypothetical protein
MLTTRRGWGRLAKKPASGKAIPCATADGQSTRVCAVAATTASTRSRKVRQRRSLSWTRPAESLLRSAAWEMSSAAE